MSVHVSGTETALRAEEGHVEASRGSAGRAATMTPLAIRVWGEYTEMPGLHLTVRQAARLFDVSTDVAGAVLHELRRASILAGSDDGTYALITDPSRKRTGAGRHDHGRR